MSGAIRPPTPAAPSSRRWRSPSCGWRGAKRQSPTRSPTRSKKSFRRVSISHVLVRRDSEAKKNEEGEFTMRVMVIIKANEQSEAGVLPDEKLLADMGKYNEELVKAGIMLAGEGLR